MNIVDLFHCLFWFFYKLNRYTATCIFVNSSQKRNCYLSVNIFDISTHQWSLARCFSVCKYVFLPFSGILTWKCINHYHLAHLISLFIILQSVTFPFHFILWSSKHQSYLFIYLETSKYLRRYLVFCLFLFK